MEAFALARDYTLDNANTVERFRRLPLELHVVGPCRRRRARPLSRRPAALDAEGGVIFDGLDYTPLPRALVEDVRSWSYMKFPYIKALGHDDGWYRVGPLARMNTASLIDTPLANAARDELMATNGSLPRMRSWPITGRG
jgi:NAD-reducing hydrogenase large subunit